MQYALIADLHSSFSDTRAVLQDIRKRAPAATIFSLGDLHECHVGKKRARRYTYESIAHVVTLNSEYLQLLDFETLLGNQEERIFSLVPLGMSRSLDQLRSALRTKQIGDALFLHGDQFEWSYELVPDTTRFKQRLLFFGHSHQRGLFKDGHRMSAHLDIPISVKKGRYAINVGPVLVEREWLLYDTETASILYRQAR
ncbi:metallophosphoesterase family protein [Exiguobacterium oxidotolerans]|uniref:Metallophosphatase family protein n=1 Tax=Exiguobacterium oxidotolerans TaxID=223958 RepID=A0A653I1D4_9BACL|nr:metallophosphoesterase family protein [Exiguobacterium oxidotolerans]VWX32687.1 Metallophosphatase family protein [Exiguobacterium oxidotolerans]